MFHSGAVGSGGADRGEIASRDMLHGLLTLCARTERVGTRYVGVVSQCLSSEEEGTFLQETSLVPDIFQRIIIIFS